MACYYYEVKHLGRWSSRATLLEPMISRELSVIHTKPQRVSKEDEGKTLAELTALYGINCRPEMFRSIRNETSHHPQLQKAADEYQSSDGDASVGDARSSSE